MITYIVTHYHAFGHTVGLIKTDKDPEWVQEHLNEIAEQLGFDYDIDSDYESGGKESLDFDCIDEDDILII